MTPFADSDFFLVMGIFAGLLWLLKCLKLSFFSFSGGILAISLLFLVFYFPYPYHVLITVIYSYLVYYLFSFILKHKNKLTGSLFLLLPMILVKSDIRFHFYPFHLNDILSFAGLSFMSFRILQVYLDTQPGDKPIQPLSYLSFLIFTPTLLIGPIDRFQRFKQDIQGGFKQLNTTRLADGFQVLLYGILYKYIMAALIDRFWLSSVDSTSKELFPMINNMYAYFLYLFFDFAGYSHMAIGLAKIIGIDVPKNFEMPFLARNPQDFWQRFHITLGDWLKDYFFKPFYLFLSKRSLFQPYPLLRQNISLFLTFTLMGCWNGFQRQYIISGMIFGLYSLVYNTYIYYSKKKRKDLVFGGMPDRYIRIISILIMFNLAAFSIYIFSGRFPYIQ